MSSENNIVDSTIPNTLEGTVVNNTALQDSAFDNSIKNNTVDITTPTNNQASNNNNIALTDNIAVGTSSRQESVSFNDSSRNTLDSSKVVTFLDRNAPVNREPKTSQFVDQGVQSPGFQNETVKFTSAAPDSLGNETLQITNTAPSKGSDDDIFLTDKPTNKLSPIDTDFVNRPEYNFYREELETSASTSAEPDIVLPNAEVYNNLADIAPTNISSNPELFTNGDIIDVLPLLNPQENIEIEPTNTNSAYGINNTPLATFNPGLALNNVLRDILQPLPANVLAPIPQPREGINIENNLTPEQLQFNKFQRTSIRPTIEQDPSSKTLVSLEGQTNDQSSFQTVAESIRPNLADQEKNETKETKYFTDAKDARNPFIPAVEPPTFSTITGDSSLNVPTVPYFLRSVLSTPAGALPKGALWALSFEAPATGGGFYEGGIPLTCISAIRSYEPTNFVGWNITTAASVLTNESYNGQKGCMFAQSVMVPNESYTAQPDGTVQKNGLIQSYVGQGRNMPGTLRVSFLETNIDFIDNILRPWVIMTGHLGLIARTGIQQYRTNVRFWKFGLTSAGQPPTILGEYNFFGICPINVDSSEYTYVSDQSPTRRTVEFIYQYYTYSSFKNAFALANA